jgi:hypothetical protein
MDLLRRAEPLYSVGVDEGFSRASTGRDRVSADPESALA